MQQTQRQYGANEGRCQGWQLAKERLLSLLDRLLASARILRSFNQTDQLSRLREIHRKTVDALLRVDQRLQQNNVVTRTYGNLKCPECSENSVKVTINRGAIVSGKASCGFCGFRVEVALLSKVPIGKCPRCGYIATIAQGKREDGRIFFAFSCDRCGWVADDRFMSVAFCLLPH
ncbi:MAG: hypothetical protein RMK89_05875 [Armatimonadota bacterium]|nr:hypothetical protein [Armatimonadota bacterium]MDW8142975.1 hypothetical protein [Armatimonadota bacterium]